MNSPQQARQLAEIDTMIEKVDQLREERERRLEVEEMTRRLREKRLASAGSTSAAALEAFVQDVYRAAFHGIPWPTGWRVNWGLTGDKALARCDYERKTIVVNHHRHGQGRYATAAEFLDTIVHELAHMLHPGADHGPSWARTLASALTYVKPIPTILERAQTFVRLGGERPPQSSASLAPGGPRSKTSKEVVMTMTNHARREILAPGEIDAAEKALRLKKFHADLLRHRSDAASYDVVYKPRIDAAGRWHPKPILTKARGKK
jgi:hypothetical protein